MARDIVERESDDLFMGISMEGMMMMVLMIMVVVQLTQMGNLQQGQVPSGISQLSVSTDHIGSRLYLNPPWMSFTMTNSGPGDLVVEVNGEEVRSIDRMVPQGGTLNVDLGYAIIEMIYIQSPHGNATAEFFGIRGRQQ